MADNVILNLGSGGSTVASDDIGGIQYQRVKTTFGADGVATDVSATNPMPVSSMRTAPVKETYSASVNALVAAALATDIFTITGSATKTIKITKIQIDGTATGAAVAPVLLLKRSTANTAGTSTAPTKVPLDSNFAAATATVLAYTANPTVGTLVGAIRQEKVLISTATTNGETVLMQFGDLTGSPIVLRGITQVIAFNLNGVTYAGNSFNMFVEWTEE